MTDSTEKRKRKWDQVDDPTKLKEGQSISNKSDENIKTSSIPITSTTIQPNEAALEAMAKLNAILAAKGLVTEKGLAQQSSSNSANIEINRKKEDDHELFVQEIEINDLPNRFQLTKGQTQLQIHNETKATVVTRGRYYADKSHVGDGERPLYLHISAKTKEELDAAVSRVEEIIANQSRPTTLKSSIAPGDLKSLKLETGIDDPAFHLKAKLLGPGGSYLKHIQTQTGAKIQLRGRGSGFPEPGLGAEAPGPLFVHITCVSEAGLDSAKQLCEDLLATVRSEYETFKSKFMGGGGGFNRNYRYGGYQPLYQQYPQYRGGYSQPLPPPPLPQQQQPPPPPSSSMSPSISVMNASTTMATPTDYNYGYYNNYYGYEYGYPSVTTAPIQGAELGVSTHGEVTSSFPAAASSLAHAPSPHLHSSPTPAPVPAPPFVDPNYAYYNNYYSYPSNEYAAYYQQPLTQPPPPPLPSTSISSVIPEAHTTTTEALSKNHSYDHLGKHDSVSNEQEPQEKDPTDYRHMPPPSIYNEQSRGRKYHP